MSNLKKLWIKYKEIIVYLFFGVLTTLVNIVFSGIFHALGMETFLTTVLANIIAMTFAFVTNKIWVFNSRTKGLALLKEAGEFYAARVLSMVFDAFFMKSLYDWTGWGGAAWGMTILFGREIDWFFYLLKIISNVIVIILNYIASKLWIFRKKKK